MTTAGPVLGRTRQLASDLWEISRPGLFLVSLVPYYVGYLLAGEELIGPATGLVGLVVWGPLVWLAVLAINDAYDLPGDLLNPRKNTPLTAGRISERGAKAAAYCAAALAIGLSFAVRPEMALATFGFLLCGWVYSVPPLKWKNRPGLDVVSNCIPLGVFTVMGGWATVKPLDGFPWIVAGVVLLVEIALYTPTMIPDIDSDRASGYTTMAVKIGARRTYLLGFACWTAFWVVTTVMAALGEVFPSWMVWFWAPCAPVFVWLYHHGLAKAREPKDIGKGMLLVGKLFLIPCVVFALAYVGVIG
ncbi:UbiA family prenyltransferase [Actinocorallia sp. API 0066]|uniref:UbiA family prenyltransferase n=1 Tax=Actinocorallia sp. API 0066 TaxID=2896846 RepID=UPI001E37970C|nr:UbiA family prenyltransferase [Actinocorallia sp. API 0066]MCD0447774.1 UbiA family prenyltransferase [Actinocorallia sp. API 0066]